MKTAYGVLLLCGWCLSGISCTEGEPTPPAQTAQQEYPMKDTPDFNGENAYAHCDALCKMGPRPSGSAAYELQLQYITRYLQEYGWRVERHSFTAPHGVTMTNLHAFYGEKTQPRPLILTCHIDTKIGISDDFVGADDGASGAAVLVETARILAKEPALAEGVELVFFDGEESVALRMSETDGLYGSRFDVARRGDTLPRYMINLDMVGARNKTIGVPLFDSSPELVEAYEACVKELGLNNKKWTITDNEYWDDDRHFREAGVATINLICDFVNSVWWHTTRDNMSRICPNSLKESGVVTLALIRRVLQLP
ncbi:MAG: Zn-dependent exopeptidase M28 [Akkermansiaceae bacterium]|nr:Zn-dependent exopeptidase M28 [Akkermansiaceae bacterium]